MSVRNGKKDTKVMQRRARELLVRVKALRDQSERLASMDLRLQANRIASAGVDMSKLSEEEIPIAKQKKQRRRKKRLPKTEEQKGTRYKEKPGAQDLVESQ